jgi:hypothetical protein
VLISKVGGIWLWLDVIKDPPMRLPNIAEGIVLMFGRGAVTCPSSAIFLHALAMVPNESQGETAAQTRGNVGHF